MSVEPRKGWKTRPAQLKPGITRKTTTNNTTSLPSHYLDLEVTHTNHHIIKTTSSILAGNAATKLSTIYDAGGDGAEMKLAKRKLTQLGVVNSHSGVVNSAELL
jgi:hypothetical protein